MSELILKGTELFMEKTGSADKLHISGNTERMLFLILGILLVFAGAKVYRLIVSFIMFWGVTIALCTVMDGKTGWGTIVTAFTILGCLMGYMAFKWKTADSMILSAMTAAAVVWMCYPFWWAVVIFAAGAAAAAAFFPLEGAILSSVVAGMFLLAAFYQQIPVGHVEAGLRTYNMKSPYPEEFNRQAIGLTASLHFAPTQKAANALLKEGKDPERIFITGNTGIDALHYTVRSDFYHPETEWAKGSRLIAVTAHRRENLGEPMRDMFRAIRRIVEEFTDVKVIYPVHLNPQVRKIADEEFGGCERIHLIEPLDVVEFHNLMKASYLIMTDSGGIQEEAPALGKPVLVMRDTTERPEGVEARTLKLVGTKMEDIYRECRRLLTEPETYRKMSEARNPYGDGTASIKIRKILEDIDA